MAQQTDPVAELRTLIREAHGLTKDLKALIKEAKAVNETLERSVSVTVKMELDDIIIDEATKRMDSFRVETREVITEIAGQYKEYMDRLTKPYRDTINRLGKALEAAEQMGLIDRMQEMQALKIGDELDRPKAF